MTDTHAQLLPVYFREPSVNLGIGAMAGKPPHLVGRAFSSGLACGLTAPTPIFHLPRFRSPPPASAGSAASRI